MPTILSATCEHCGAPFQYPKGSAGQHKPRKFCSRSCSFLSHRRRVESMAERPDRERIADRCAESLRPAEGDSIELPLASGHGRHKPGRDPTTATIDYTAEEVEFLQAIERFKREKRRPFPTWSEALAVLRSLGYRKVM